MSRFSIHVVEDMSKNFASFNTPSFHKDEIEHPQHLLENIQEYIPIYQRFFDMSSNMYNSMSLNHRYHLVTGRDVYDCQEKTLIKKDFFVKYSPLLDPLRYMIGKYDNYGDTKHTLPSVIRKHPISKLEDVNNSAYTDGFFYYLTSRLGQHYHFPHGIDYYGSYLAIQKYYKINVEDDLEYLSGAPYFNENLNRLFVITNSDCERYNGTCKNKEPLQITKTIKHNMTTYSLDNVDTDSVADITSSDSSELIYENNNVIEKTDQSSESSSTTSSSNSSLNYSSGESENNEDNDSEEWETDDESDNSSSSTDNEAHAIIYDYPVQIICLEKCECTLDKLFESEQVNVENGASILFQIVMVLLCYQKVFHFTHNDLHTNNIMYNETEQTHLVYKYLGQHYKVPTHGKLFKLIDFGRSIYKYDGKTFCSDSFAPSGDASSQYNCEPYMTEDKPRIEPNMSFDLCRLGCSIYDFIMRGEDETKHNELQKTIVRWCTDDNGKNVLYKKNGDDRYPNFKLYKMIARTVHKHTPAEQLKLDYFKQFACEKPDTSCDVVDIDAMIYHG